MGVHFVFSITLPTFAFGFIIFDMPIRNELSDKEDHDLVTLFLNGSQKAFEELYIRYKRRLVHYCKWLLKDETESEDIVQDIFLQLWENRHTLKIDISFAGYVKTLAQNRALNEFRSFNIHSRYAQSIMLSGSDYTNQTEDTIIYNDYERLLNEIIESLPARQKEIFRLSRIDGLSYKEISEILHLSIPAVQKHASQALKKIMDYLQQHADIHFQM